MFILLSPSKTQNFKQKSNFDHTQPFFAEEIQKLIKELRKYKIDDLQKLMSISPKLAQLNFERFRVFGLKFLIENAKQAITAFTGDVYDGIEVEQYTDKDMKFAQDHVGIISGLYGLLRPLDLIQSYRLEMGLSLQVDGKRNLYDFWGDKITERVNQLNKSGSEVVNLASAEYSRVINPRKIHATYINVAFQEYDEGSYKIVGILAKRARGVMANYIIKNRILSYEDLKNFDLNGYAFLKERSDSNNLVFVR